MTKGTAILASDLSERVPGRFLIIAHRGYSSGYHENSVDAFKEAIAAGSDLIEADLRESSDGVVVLSHDDVGDETFEKLTARGIAKFSTFLEFVGKKALLLLDLKNHGLPFLRKVFDAVRKKDMQNQVVFGVRTIDQTHELRRLDPEVVILGLLSRESYDFENFYEAGGHIGRLWQEDLDPATIEKARGDGSRPIWITPRDDDGVVGGIDRRRQDAVMKSGLDGILVNDPTAAIEARSAALGTIGQ